jgi:hypothetical protein
LFTDEAVLAKYGFLYNRFKPEFWWYETSEVIRKMIMGSLVQFIMPNGKSGSASQMLVATVINVLYTVLFLALWPFKGIDDNMLMGLSMVAITVTLFCALAINGEIVAMDSWGDGTTTGVLLGINGTLLVMYFAMMYHYQLPFICRHLTPDFIAKSPFNCFKNKGRNQAEGGLTDEEYARASKAREEREAFAEEQKAFFFKYGKIEYVKAPDPPPAPLPHADVNMSDKELHEEMEKYFHRYDLDESGTLNSVDELQQLCTNLCFKLDLQLSGDEIDSVVNCAGELNDENQWDIDEFCEWFEERFLGEDSEEQSFSAAMMNNITMYQNMEMQDDVLAAEEEAEELQGELGDY